MARAGSPELSAIEGALVRAAERGIPRLPAFVDAPLAEIIGTASFLAAGGARSAVRENLRIVAPERANARSVRRVFVEQARNYVEIMRIPTFDPATFLASVDQRGWEHFAAAHAKGRGVIVASAHIGPVSLVGQLFIARGYETVLPVEPERSEFQRAINRGRAAMGLQIVTTDAPLGIVRALRAGKVFGLLADRAVTGVGERVPFFGREALLPSVHIALALRTGVPVVPGFSSRERGRLTASFEPELELVATGDRNADVREGVRRWALVLERYVRRTPEQWTVFEPFWAAPGPKARS